MIRAVTDFEIDVDGARVTVRAGEEIDAETAQTFNVVEKGLARDETGRAKKGRP